MLMSLDDEAVKKDPLEVFEVQEILGEGCARAGTQNRAAARPGARARRQLRPASMDDASCIGACVYE